jgi:4-amino-4-deoxy-L-arabinose transferase-like glycosyltransferase
VSGPIVTVRDRRGGRADRADPREPIGVSWRPGGLLVAIGLAGVVIRVVATVTLANDVELGITDASFYSAAANHIASGEGYVDIWRSLAEGETLRTAHHPPGWPALLSVFSFLGVETQLGHRLVGAVLGGGVVVLLGLLGRRLGGRRVGVAAATLAAVHPTLVAADGSLMAETLAGLLVLVVVLLGLDTADLPTSWRAVGLGLTIGLAALVRGEGLLYLGLVVVPVALVAARRASDRGGRIAFRTGGLALLAVLAVVLPWSIRNTLLFDRFVLISINDSTVLAGANCDAAYHGDGTGSWQIDCIRGTGGTEADEAALWREEGLRYMRDNADRLPAVVTARLLRTWGLRDGFPPVAEGRHLGTQSVGNVVWLALLFPGGVAGAVVLGRRRQLPELVMALAPVAAGTIVTIVGFGMLRFRHPIELSAVVLTAVAVVAAVDARKRRGPGRPRTGAPPDRRPPAGSDQLDRAP